MARTDKNRLDDALGEIATLVKIPEDRGPYFRSLVRGTVNDAVPRIKRLRFSDESIASQLKTVTRKTHELLAHLRKKRNRRLTTSRGSNGPGADDQTFYIPT
jgi:hypothetical protein